MSRNQHSKLALFFVLFIPALALIACTGKEETVGEGDFSSIWRDNYIPGETNSEPNPLYNFTEGTYPVEPIFEDFYLELGGFEILGPAISPTYNSVDEVKQYVEAGLMVYDGKKAFNDRFFLSPLGVGFQITDPSIVGQLKPEEVTLTRRFIYPSFVTMYDQLGGARFVGRPLTTARHNPEKNRIEQYFENLGFYILDPANNAEVRLLAYGAFACGRDCRYQPATMSIPSLRPILPEPFASKSNELGLEFTGRTLTEIYSIQGTQHEVIFQNLVLWNDESQGEVIAKPIVEALGFESQPLVPRSDNALMIFVPVDGELGHNVPVFFMDYLNRYGGLNISGLPLGEVVSDQEGIFWQCFENLCLEFVVSESGSDQLSLASIGYRYKQLNYDMARNFLESQSLAGVELKFWEKYSFLSAEDYQEIHVVVYQEGIPLRNREPILLLTMPDGNILQNYFPPTDANGKTMLKLPPIRASNGTLITYQISLHGLKGEEYLVGDNYLVWNSE